jgi:acetylglutamate kinase
MAPLSFDGKGSLLNTNADTIASSVARALAERFMVTLVYCFEKAGVLRDPDDEGSVIPLITKESFASLVADGTVAGGMIPKLQNAIDALEGGVGEVRITRSDAPEGGTRIIL